MIELKFKEYSPEETMKQFADPNIKNLRLEHIERHPDGIIVLGFSQIAQKEITR